MVRIGKENVCRTVGELKRAIADLPDYMCFCFSDNLTVEVWKIQKNTDGLSWLEEKEDAGICGREPDYRAVTISEEGSRY